MVVAKSPTMVPFMHIPKRMFVASYYLFLSSIDWDLNSKVKSHDKYSQLFRQAIINFEPLNFSCFEAHLFPMAVLVRTIYAA